MSRSFEEYLTERNDMLANAAYQLLCMMADPNYDLDDDDNRCLELDMEHIGVLLDTAKSVLHEMVGIQPCYPYYASDVINKWVDYPCYKNADCQRKDCPFRMQEEA